MTNNLVEQCLSDGSRENPIILKNRELFLNEDLGYFYKFTCKCGKEVVKKKYNKDVLPLCRVCSLKQTSLEKYGTEYPNQSREQRQKISNILKQKYQDPDALNEMMAKKEKTSIQKYGCSYAQSSSIVKEKTRNTFLDKYGVSCSLQNEQIKEKSIKTCIEKYGCENPSSTPSVKQKRKKTCVEKYGGETPFFDKNVNLKRQHTMISKYGSKHALQSEHGKESFKKTCNERLGVDYPAQNKEVFDKLRKTNIEKYGVACSLQNKEVRNKANETLVARYGRCDGIHKVNKYVYNEIIFDSYWELCFYVYHVDNNIIIIREPMFIKYTFNDEEHLYYPDFEVNGQLYEIKGSQFFKEDGTMCNPYDRSKDEIFEAKRQCALRNNVIFVMQDDIKPYIDYVESKYGKSFKEEHKV